MQIWAVGEPAMSHQIWWELQKPKHVGMITEYDITILEMAWLVENI